MDDDDRSSKLEEQARRCRRLARAIVDDDVRHALEHLAEEYEDKLREEKRERPFMLRKRKDDED